MKNDNTQKQDTEADETKNYHAHFSHITEKHKNVFFKLKWGNWKTIT